MRQQSDPFIWLCLKFSIRFPISAHWSSQIGFVNKSTRNGCLSWLTYFKIKNDWIDWFDYNKIHLGTCSGLDPDRVRVVLRAAHWLQAPPRSLLVLYVTYGKVSVYGQPRSSSHLDLLPDLTFISYQLFVVFLFCRFMMVIVATTVQIG